VAALNPRHYEVKVIPDVVQPVIFRRTVAGAGEHYGSSWGSKRGAGLCAELRRTDLNGHVRTRADLLKSDINRSARYREQN
jgi:hypothetical protein